MVLYIAINKQTGEAINKADSSCTTGVSCQVKVLFAFFYKIIHLVQYDCTKLA
jgi:hypothetical protein